MSPAKVVAIELNTEEKIAVVTVPADQFSLAIGKGGQNVRLAAKLTGWTITVQQTEAVPAHVDEVEIETELITPTESPVVSESVTEVEA